LVDIQNTGYEGVRLICAGTLKEITGKGIKLKDGLHLLIWSEDQDDDGKADNLIVEAVVKFSDVDKCWVAQFDYAQLKHESDKI